MKKLVIFLIIIFYISVILLDHKIIGLEKQIIELNKELSLYKEVVDLISPNNKGLVQVYRKMANEVDRHKIFPSHDIVDQRALLLLCQPTFGHNPDIEEIIYREFRAGSLDRARSWKGLYNMAADRGIN